MSEIVTGVSILTEVTAGSAVKASGVTMLTELIAPSAVRAAGVLILVEILDPIPATGLVPITLNTRSLAHHLRTRRKTYFTLNERTAALTLEERP